MNSSQLSKNYFPEVPEVSLKPLFRVADENSNGELDLTEFVLLVRFLEKYPIKDPFELLFRKCDFNGNGVLEPAEFCVAMKCLFPDISDERVVELFDSTDKDRNRTIDLNEFMILVEPLRKELKIE